MRIRLAEYLRFLESSPHSRNVTEGQNVQQAGHIIMYGITSDLDNIKEVFALCLQTSGLSNSPHEVKITLKVSSEVTITSAKCL